MHFLSSTTGPVGYGETPGKTGNTPAPSPGKVSEQDLIARANSVPIKHVFKHYGLRFDLYTHKATCPFKAHKGGKENTPSFTLYEDTNSFSCFGCGKGGHAVMFVAEMDRCKFDKAAAKILQLFGTEVDEELIVASGNNSERQEIMQKFSASVFDFRQNHSEKHALDFIEYICWVYDRSNELHKYDNEALRRLVEHCVEHIDIYTPQLTLTLQKEYLKLICNS